MAASPFPHSVSEKWLVVPKDRDELLSVTRDLITEVRELSDVIVKLQKLKGNEELTEKLDEVLREIDSQFDKIIETVHTSDMVHTHLKNLRISIEKIYQFFIAVQQTRVIFFAKSRLRKQMILLYNTLRHSCTQLMASVSLELLTKTASQRPPTPTPTPVDVTDWELEKEVIEGHRFYYGINVFKNYLRAFKHYVFAAERDHLEAMIMTGKMYQYGHGLEKDLEKATAWYKRAEALGSSIAKYCLAFLIFDELRVDLHHSKYHIDDRSIGCSSSSSRGHNENHNSSSNQENDNEPSDEEIIREEKLQEATKLLTASAQMGYTNAQTALGQLYELREEYEAAKGWYELASSNGCLRAVNILGMLYYEGLGVPKLKEKAFALFEEASLGGDLSASNNVAKCLEDGIGVEKDIPAALEIYKYSADNGNAQASYGYGYLLVKSVLGDETTLKLQNNHNKNKNQNSHELINYENEKFRQTSLQVGVKYLRAAVEGGIADAGFQLGKLYEHGIGIPYDLNSAFSYYHWSSQLGHGKASLCAANMIYEQYIQTLHDGNEIENENDDNSTTRFHQKTSIPNDLNEALELYYNASQLGLPEAMNAYAMLIEEGNGINFSSDVNERDRMMEAAKWYYAAAMAGKVESAGNLLLLLTTYPYLHSIETVEGTHLSIQEIKLWLHSYTKRHTSVGSNLYESLKSRDIIIPNEDNNDQEEDYQQFQQQHHHHNHHHSQHQHHQQRNNQNSHNSSEPIFSRSSRAPPHPTSSSLLSSHSQPHSQQQRYLYSKHHPSHREANSGPLSGPSQDPHPHPDNKILSKLEIYPEEKGDYLANKLKTYSKFSLTSDLIARKNEYNDGLKWSQQRAAGGGLGGGGRGGAAGPSQRGQQEEKNSLQNFENPKNPLMMLTNKKTDENNFTNENNSSDLKNVTKFIQTANRFNQKRSIPSSSSPSPGAGAGSGSGPSAGRGAAAVSGPSGGGSTSRPLPPPPPQSPLPASSKQRNESSKPIEVKPDDSSSASVSGSDSAYDDESEEKESSELDMERIIDQNKGNGNGKGKGMDKRGGSSTGNISQNNKNIQEFLDQSEHSEGSDLPALTHRQDRQMSLTKKKSEELPQNRFSPQESLKSQSNQTNSTSSSLNNLKQRKSNSYSLYK